MISETEIRTILGLFLAISAGIGGQIAYIYLYTLSRTKLAGGKEHV